MAALLPARWKNQPRRERATLTNCILRVTAPGTPSVAYFGMLDRS